MMGLLKELLGQRSKDFIDGMAEEIKFYAHWDNGKQYVGTTGKLLSRALEELEELK